MKMTIFKQLTTCMIKLTYGWKSRTFMKWWNITCMKQNPRPYGWIASTRAIIYVCNFIHEPNFIMLAKFHPFHQLDWDQLHTCNVLHTSHLHGHCFLFNFINVFCFYNSPSVLPTFIHMVISHILSTSSIQSTFMNKSHKGLEVMKMQCTSLHDGKGINMSNVFC
jgi:hypothetical protein